MKIQKKNWGGGSEGGGAGAGVGLWGQGGCERRIEVFVKIQKIISGGGVGLGGQGGCKQRIEIFVKIKKKIGGSGQRGVTTVQGGGVLVDVYEELKF